jgi:hypothetical protein
MHYKHDFDIFTLCLKHLVIINEQKLINAFVNKFIHSLFFYHENITFENLLIDDSLNLNINK